jgi:hypothetical protein
LFQQVYPVGHGGHVACRNEPPGKDPAPLGTVLAVADDLFFSWIASTEYRQRFGS